MDNDYLTHHGILGMKWGVRRYQNKDGTLTPAGKKRYDRDVQRTSTQLGRTMFTRKRQLAADKSDLEKLNSGKRLSVGLTKKRQDVYDKRDKAALERRIKDNEQKLANKSDKKDKDFKFVDDEVAQMPQKKRNAFLNYQKMVGLTRDNVDDPELYELIRLEFEDACERGIIDVNKSWESNEKAIRRDATKISHHDSKNSLYHYGILGMKWGVRRTPAQLGHLTKKDNKWVKKNTEKITEKARKKSSKELMKYANELMKDPNAVNKSGKLSAATINAYNKKMASLMNEQVSDLTSPSGKVVRFVAKRGEVGV
ncbi:MAG TPA: hypothetical protein GX010_02300, partial [Erysipelotrichaceae bacterium]|nr:hypothetical protein [Erysipelotrichaceae bacterium]